MHSPRLVLTEIFAVAGPVAQAKIIQDRNFQHGGLNYGFVEYSDTRAAEQALQTLNGRKIFDTEIRVNWAYQTQSQTAALGATAGAGPNAGVAGVMAPMIGGTGQPGMLTNKGKEDTHNHFHVFVGDLSPEVNDEALTKAFGAFPTMSEARVMWDMNSGKSRGYGFLAFR
jgi:nucleolysin TIA-1/TIAR